MEGSVRSCHKAIWGKNVTIGETGKNIGRRRIKFDVFEDQHIAG